MTRLRTFSIRHKVADYGKWKRGVRAAARLRKSSCEKCFRVYRDSRSPNDLTVICSRDTTARMQNFAKSAELRQAMKKAGVTGKQVVQFFSKAEDMSL